MVVTFPRSPYRRVCYNFERITFALHCADIKYITLQFEKMFSSPNISDLRCIKPNLTIYFLAATRVAPIDPSLNYCGTVTIKILEIYQGWNC